MKEATGAEEAGQRNRHNRPPIEDDAAGTSAQPPYLARGPTAAEDGCLPPGSPCRRLPDTKREDLGRRRRDLGDAGSAKLAAGSGGSCRIRPGTAGSGRRQQPTPRRRTAGRAAPCDLPHPSLTDGKKTPPPPAPRELCLPATTGGGEGRNGRGGALSGWVWSPHESPLQSDAGASGRVFPLHS